MQTRFTRRYLNAFSLVRLFKIRSLQKVGVENDQDAKEYIINYWSTTLSTIVSPIDFQKVNYLDIEHLVALRCISTSIGSRNLLKVLSENIIGKPPILLNSDIENLDWFKLLNPIYSGLIEHSNLTSIGTLIGILYRDAN